MKHKLLICSLLTLFLSLPLFSQSASKATLEIKFTGIRSDEGQISIGIGTSPKGWPKKPQIELQFKKENIVNGEFTIIVPDLSYGVIAVSALDDVNCDIEMDMVLGIPREGYGFSIDPKIRLSAPKFDACSFLLNQPHHQIGINFRYRGKDK